MKQNQTRLLKVVLKSPDETNLILRNRHKLKGPGIFVRKDLPLADRTNRREAEKLKQRLDASEEDLKFVDFRVMRLRQRVMPRPPRAQHEVI